MTCRNAIFTKIIKSDRIVLQTEVVNTTAMSLTDRYVAMRRQELPGMFDKGNSSL